MHEANASNWALVSPLTEKYAIRLQEIVHWPDSGAKVLPPSDDDTSAP